ncbi:MAG: copper chaperone PCu(A)C [Rhodocyclaceae bacterium]
MRKTAWALLLAASAAQAGVTVKEAWVRGTVAAQKATGAFMELTSSEDAALVSAASPVAGLVELHSMKMEGGVMKMRALPRLALPAGKAVKLDPGGYHVMLMDLRAPLKAGDSVPITLKVEGRDGKVSTVEVKAEVRELTASGPMGHGEKHKH